MSIYNTITNAQMATMPANTFKGNNGGSPAPPIDVTVAQLQAALNTSGFASGQVLFGGASSVIQGATALTFNVSTSVLALTGQFNASIATLSAAGVSALNLNGFGGNVSMTLGSNGLLGQAFAATAFLHDSVAGDVCIRNSSASNSLLLGISTATSSIAMSATVTSFNLPVTLPQTQAGAAVTGSVKSNFEYFEDQFSGTVFTTNSTGAIVFTGYKIRFQRIGTKVYMFPDTFSQNSVAASSITLTSAIPARFIPPSNLQFNRAGQKGGAKQDISFTLSSSGNIVIYGGVNNDTFTNGNTAAYFGDGMSYYLV
jgi:hypothetical protein